jgi:hypothetical protein
MHKRYPVVFREQGGTATAGSLEVDEDRLLLSGGTGQRRRELSVPLPEITEIRIGRLPADRLNGYATLLLDRESVPAVQVAPVGAGLLHEIADLVRTLTTERLADTEELAVVVPLRRGCRAQAAKLLAAGPPLDPGALGLTSHQVYLREDEAVFVFRGQDVSARVETAVRSPALWRAGLAWHDCIAGRPRIVRSAGLLANEEPAYTWTAPARPSSG